MTQLVTGEAVALDIRVARLASRGCALLLDLVFQLMLLNIALYVVMMTTYVADEAWSVGLTILTVALVMVGYPCACETLSRGRTLGKLAVGLRVVSDDGGPVRFRQALVRALTGFVEFFLLSGAPALLSSLFNRHGKRLGDVFAGTLVIQERMPNSALHGPVAWMPAPLAEWGRTLEVSMLPDDLAMTARQYLARFWELRPDVRERLGRRIAAQVAAVVSPPPPPGVPPAVFISAVLAERRRREEWRLWQRQERRRRKLGAAWAVVPRSPAAPVPAPVPEPAMAVAEGPPTGPVPQPPPTLPPFSTPPPGRPQFLPPPDHGPGPYQQGLPPPQRPPQPQAQPEPRPRRPQPPQTGGWPQQG